MSLFNGLSYIDYLASKKEIDNRSLNLFVKDSLVQHMSSLNSKKATRVLEVGSGIGTMIERVLEWNFLKDFEYTAIDIDPSNIEAAINRLSNWSHDHDCNFEIEKDNRILIKNQNNITIINLIAADIYDFIDKERDKKSWDLVIANAFLDLVDLKRTVPLLLSLIRPKGLFYFTLNFDGTTILKPEIEPDFDREIISLYHKTMDDRIIKGKSSGKSRTGSYLLQFLNDTGVEILDAGSSDWVIFPRGNGYSHDEKYFLHFIINTLEKALLDCKKLNENRFKEWVKLRHYQIDKNELIYIAHQLDILGRIHE